MNDESITLLIQEAQAISLSSDLSNTQRFDVIKELILQKVDVVSMGMGEFSSLISEMHEVFYKSKLVHGSYITNVAISLMLKHLEIEHDHSMAILADSVNELAQPKNKNMSATEREAMLAGQLVAKFVENGATQGASIEVAAEMFGKSEKGIKDAYQAWKKGAFLDYSEAEKESDLQWLLFGHLCNLDKLWRLDQDKLEKENHNRRRAIAAVYRAYDMITESIVDKCLPNLIKPLKAYEDPDLTSFIYEEKAEELAQRKESYSAEDCFILLTLNKQYDQKERLFELSDILKNLGK